MLTTAKKCGFLNIFLYTVIRLVSTSSEFGICTVVVMGLNGTLFEAKYALGTLECEYFNFNKCPI